MTFDPKVDNPGDQQRIPGPMAAIRGYVAWHMGSKQTAVHFAQQALELIPEMDLTLRSHASKTLGLGYGNQGILKRGTEAFHKAIELGEQSGNLNVTLYAYAYLLLSISYTAI